MPAAAPVNDRSRSSVSPDQHQEQPVNTLLRAYVRFNDLLAALCLVVASCGVAFAILALTAAALERYLYGFSYALLNDLPPLLMPWVVLPMMGTLLRSDHHISVDFLPHFLQGRGRVLLNLVVGAVAAAISLWFLYGGIDALKFFMRLNQTTETGIRFPLWWIYLSFPVGFGLLAWFSAEKALVALVTLLTGKQISTSGEGNPA
jgi:TRAP-type C4-dicarboxylate transport system permease small subunit